MCVELIKTDIAIVGAGGAGLRTAIAIAESNPDLNVALISKVYPMRSHTCAAEGGAAGVIKPDDSLELHFNDTVGGGDWLSDQDVVEYFVNEAPKELMQLEHWGCPWSREPNGSVGVRPFGGMKIKRTWFAADKSGFHILHTLFQTSLKYDNIDRFDEFFSVDLLVTDGRCQGVVAMEMKSGRLFQFQAKAVVLCTGGAGRMFPFSTNGAIKTGDGTAMAYRAGVPAKDMEFVQYHPTGLLSTGILLTEGCRGEGGVLRNKDGHRYLQDYGMGPETPLGEPVLKTMELGPRDRLSQAFWQEMQRGNTIPTRWGESVNLDMTHLGEKHINERLPLVRDLSITYAGVDPVTDPVPIRPVVHYMMGGIHTNIDAETPMPGLYAVGETACASLNGANRLGSNSLTELLVFGKRAAANAIEYARNAEAPASDAGIQEQAEKVQAKIRDLVSRSGGNETIAGIRKEMADSLESGAGIYRTEETLQETCDVLVDLRKRYAGIELHDKSNVFNTDLFQALELGNLLELAQTVAEGALARKESRGSHQRLDYEARDDENFLGHTLAYYQGNEKPRLDYHEVIITKSPPGVRDYSGGAK
jgi:fumarate reductase flavoprotein subunit